VIALIVSVDVSQTSFRVYNRFAAAHINTAAAQHAYAVCRWLVYGKPSTLRLHLLVAASRTLPRYAKLARYKATKSFTLPCSDDAHHMQYTAQAIGMCSTTTLSPNAYALAHIAAVTVHTINTTTASTTVYIKQQMTSRQPSELLQQHWHCHPVTHSCRTTLTLCYRPTQSSQQGAVLTW
jgi:hypothetical protein